MPSGAAANDRPQFGQADALQDLVGQVQMRFVELAGGAFAGDAREDEHERGSGQQIHFAASFVPTCFRMSRTERIAAAPAADKGRLANKDNWLHGIRGDPDPEHIDQR